MNTKTQLIGDWLGEAKARVKAASQKVAADQEALTGITDPTNKGNVQIPSHSDGNNRSRLNLPENSSNMDAADKEHNVMNVTKPNGTGQGEYVTPRNGDARDAAATSPTSALDKIANMLNGAVQSLQEGQHPQKTTRSKEAGATFELPVCLAEDDTLMDKLATIAGVMLGTTEGQQAVAEALEREAGIKEASAIIAGVREDLEAATSAPSASYYQHTENKMNKIAAAEAAHAAWLNSYTSDLEKCAYAQGAADAEAMSAGLEAGGAPAIPGSESLSDEEVLSAIQAMVASGEIAPEEAEALLQALGADGQVGATLQQLAAELMEAVQSGQIDPQTGEIIANAILQDAGLTGGAPAGNPEEAAALAAAQSGVNKTASVLNDLFA